MIRLAAKSREFGRLRGTTARCFSVPPAASGGDDKKAKGVPYAKLTVGIPMERYPLEKRVAATPESVSKLTKPGFRVLVERGAGGMSHFRDEDYVSAGARIVDADAIWKESDIVMKVRFFFDRRSIVRRRRSSTVDRATR
jgi:NAD(P) transhydrogenase